MTKPHRASTALKVMVAVFLLQTHNYLYIESQLLFVGYVKVLLMFKQTDRSQDN